MFSFISLIVLRLQAKVMSSDYLSLLGITPNVIVIGKGIEAKTIPDLIAIAKAKPGALNYGSAGSGVLPRIRSAAFSAVIITGA